ncbi:MAG TPA: ABC transporter substrate-binding protein [Xanthobacteraceae bacterium]|nr:ABC transporter substrate-binding protein [Xanthobacteraceae bacterium]
MVVRLLLSLCLLLIGTAAHAEDLAPWRQGNVQPKGDAGFWYMVSEGGFARAQGLDMKMLAFNSDTLMLKALVARELDSFEGSPISPMIADSKGADLKVLGCSWPKLTYSFFARPQIASIGDLRGKNVGVSAPGSLPDLVARTMLRTAGVSPDDVHFVLAGSDPDRVRAIVAGTIDAAIATSDFSARPELGLKTLARANEVVPQFLRSCIITRGEVIRDKREQLVRLMAAEINAYSYAIGHRDAVVAIAHKVANLPASDRTPEANFDEVVAHGAVSPTLEIDMAKFVWLRDLLARDGRLDAKFDPRSLVDTSVRDDALARIAAQRKGAN